MDVHEMLNSVQLSTRSRSRAIEQLPPPADASSDGNDRGEVTADEEEQHSPAPEIVELTIRLEDFPELRGEVVKAAKRKLRDRAYLTRESAEQLARVLVGDQT